MTEQNGQQAEEDQKLLSLLTDKFSFLPAGENNSLAVPTKGVVLDSYGNKVSKYHREKAEGLRRSNGARKLKRLTSRHLKIISLHLAGESGEKIAVLCHCTPVTVSRILNDPLAREVISRVYEDRQGEIDALAGEAIKAVRDTLKGDHTPRTKLAAVDKFVKLKDSIGRQDDSAKTAEDVVRQIFQVQGTNVQINVGEG